MSELTQIVRDFYEARNRRDWASVEGLLAPEVAWHEADGATDYAGDHHGREHVVALLRRFVEVTGGTFVLEPQAAVETAEHVAAAVTWRAERGDAEAAGNDLAVFRVDGGSIVAAWFFPDGFDPQAVAEVFSFAAS